MIQCYKEAKFGKPVGTYHSMSIILVFLFTEYILFFNVPTYYHQFTLETSITPQQFPLSSSTETIIIWFTKKQGPFTSCRSEVFGQTAFAIRNTCRKISPATSSFNEVTGQTPNKLLIQNSDIDIFLGLPNSLKNSVRHIKMSVSNHWILDSLGVLLLRTCYLQELEGAIIPKKDAQGKKPFY